jgi:hypothetical protein
MDLSDQSPQDLDQIAQGVGKNKTLDLADPAIAGAQTGALLGILFLQSQPLAAGAVTVLSCLASTDGAGLHFTGTFAAGPLGGPVSVAGCVFDLASTTQHGMERHCVLLFDLPTSVDPIHFLSPYSQFADSVAPYLSGGGDIPFLKRLDFAEQKVLFSSLDFTSAAYKDTALPAEIAGFLPAVAIQAGLHFKVEFDLVDEMAAALRLVSLSGPFAYTGAVLSQDRGLVLRTSRDYVPASSFELSAFKFQLSDIGLEFLLSSLGRAYPTVTLRGALAIESASVSFEADFDMAVSRLQIALTESVDLPSLEDFARLVHLPDGIGPYLPENAGGYGSFTLESLSLTMDVDPVYIYEAAFVVSTKKPVTLMPGVMTVEPVLRLTVACPFDPPNRTETVMLAGRWRLGENPGTAFDTMLSLADKTLSAEMARGETLDVSALLDKILPGVQLPSGSIVLMDMEFEADWGNKSFEAEIDVATDWEFEVLGATFAVYELGMQMAYADRKVMECVLSGRLTLAGLELDALGNYDEGSGWVLRAGTTVGEEISLTRIFERLKSEFTGSSGSLDDVPPEYLEIAINDLSLEYRTADSSMTFYCSLAKKLEFNENFSADLLFLQIDSGKELTGLCRATLTVAGVSLFLTCAKTKAGWEFSGSSGDGQEIPIGEIIDDLVRKFGPISLPSAIADLAIENIGVSYKSASRDFTFTLESKFPVEDREVDITIKLDVTHRDDGVTTSFGGQIKIGSLFFDLIFEQDAASKSFLATYQHKDQQSIKLKELVGAVSSRMSGIIPDSFEVDLKDVLFAFSKAAAETKFLFGLDIGTSVSLSDLPLVGNKFPAHQSASIDDLRLLAVSRPLTSKEVAKINAALPSGFAKISVPAAGPDPNNAGDTSEASTDTTAIEEGVTISATINFGSSTEVLALPVTHGSTPETETEGQQSKAVTTAPAATGDDTKWFKVQKTFGPVSLQRVGVRYTDSTLWFLLDAALSGAGLTLSLEGLALGSPIDRFSPHFDLSGLGINYSGGSVAIEGAFLRKHVTKDGKSYDEYDGAAVIKTTQLTLSALGSYAYVDDHPSLFVYAILDYPLGGPSFFFITGLAAGFGYNRSLLIPPVEEVADFPLVKEALEGAKMPQDVGGELAKIGQYISPAIGESFFAVGIKFTSFKMIESFVLLTMAFGTKTEINLLGLSTLVVPTPKVGDTGTPLAEVQIALRATFDPDEGSLKIDARLTSASFILSKDCHLTGGYAFYSWFKGDHAGDFVQTLGGYHPAFEVPAHYPVVPRLGFNWNVDDHLTIKGDAYYALTSHALMAGGHLDATWEDGDLEAYFRVGADFLISWQPYHYDAEVYVEFGVEYSFSFFGRHHISVGIGADLHIWGPEFSGRAHIHLWIISFDVPFGAGASKTPKPIDWDTFRGSFLPADNVCGISVKEGLIRKVTEDVGDLGVINAKHFALVTNSVIPSTKATLNGAPVTLKQQVGAVGIGSMALKPGDLTSTFDIRVTRDNVRAESDFEFVPVFKKVPAGLWGESLIPDVNGQTFIENALCGFELRPAIEPQPGQTSWIDRSALSYDTETIPDAYEWERSIEFAAALSDGTEAEAESKRRNIISDGLASAANARAALLLSMGINPQQVRFSTHTRIGDDFLIAPQVEAVPSSLQP